MKLPVVSASMWRSVLSTEKRTQADSSAEDASAVEAEMCGSFRKMGQGLVAGNTVLLICVQVYTKKIL